MKFAVQKRWRDANPVATSAHSATRSAIRRGLVTPGPCEQCGTDKAEAHHPDYSRPMHVERFCRQYHKAEHAKLRGPTGDA